MIVLTLAAALAASTVAGPLRASPEVTAAPKLGVPEADTSKNCYLPGEEVTIILRNIGQGNLLYGYVPNFIVENGTTIGTVRDALGGFPRQSVVIPSGGNMTWTWDGNWDRLDGLHKGQLVPPADYDAVIEVLAGFPIPDLVEIDRARFSIGPCVAQISAGEDLFVDEGANFSFNPIIHITGNATVTSVTWDLDPSSDANGDGNATNDIDLTGETPTFAFGDDGTYPVVMNLRGFGTIESKERLDQDVVFVIDGSGSMAQADPFQMRKFAAKAYVDRLVPDDRAAAVSFADAGILINNHHLSMNYTQVKADLDWIGAGGGSFLSSGIRRGLNELKDYGDASHVWVEIFISDGDSTHARDHFEIPRAITLAQELGIKVYTVGLSVTDPDIEALMRQIATDTGGKYFPAATPENLVAILDDVAQEINETVGSYFVVSDDVQVTVRNVDPTVDASGDVRQATPANITLRVAGEKFHDVRLGLLRDGAEVGRATVVRMPGSPDEQAATIAGTLLPGNVNVAHIVYTPLDDPINGQEWGADPAWVNVTAPNGTVFVFQHTFNVRHPDTWVWDVDLSDVAAGGQATAALNVTVGDPGTDDIAIRIDWGDGTAPTATSVFNDGVGPDPFPSPGGMPVALSLLFAHSYSRAGTYTVTITAEDDDGGAATTTVTLVVS